MNFIQPSIDPVILSIGFIEIRWYSLAYILGFLLGIYIIKRLNKIKDFSNFIPGHGGVLDRLDGFILLVIVFNTVNYLI